MPLKKPNIVLIFSDQHRHDAMGCAGNPDIQTPNLDWLASQGTRYDTVWCQAPFCQPSRASFITGCYPQQLGFQDLSSVNNPPTLMKKLQALGYETATIGKMHYTEIANLQKLAESQSINTADFNDHFKQYGWNYLVQEFDKYHHVTPGVTTPYLSYLESQGLKKAYQQQVKQHMRGTPNHWRAATLPFAQKHDLTTFLTDHALSWLIDRESEKAFFLKIGYVQPHPPLIADPEWAAIYANKDIQLPNFERIKATVPIWKAYIDKLEKHAQLSNMKKIHITAAIKQYYAAISLIDQQIGRLLDQLRSTGEIDNTIIIYTADHGEMMGEKRLWGKMNFYKGSVQVPLIVKNCAGSSGQAQVIKKPLELLDLHEAIVTTANSNETSTNFNQLLSRKAQTKTHSLSQHGEFTSILLDGIRYTEHTPSKTACEFFDVTSDSSELTNLAASKAYKKRVKEASKSLQGAIKNMQPYK